MTIELITYIGLVAVVLFVWWMAKDHHCSDSEDDLF